MFSDFIKRVPHAHSSKFDSKRNQIVKSKELNFHVSVSKLQAPTRRVAEIKRREAVQTSFFGKKFCMTAMPSNGEEIRTGPGKGAQDGNSRECNPQCSASLEIVTVRNQIHREAGEDEKSVETHPGTAPIPRGVSRIFLGRAISNFCLVDQFSGT